MKKTLILFAFIAYCCSSAIAQEEAVFMHYIFNPTLINPAATGFDKEHHDVFINVRSSWTNFPDAPKTYALSYNGPVGKRLGLGAMIYSENVAGLTRFRGQLSYAFQYQIKDFDMAFGMSTEWHRTSIDNSVTNSVLYEEGDERVLAAMDGETEFDATIGIYGGYKDRIFFGLSSPGLVRGKLDQISDTGDGGPFQYLLANLGGKFELAESKVKLMPSILVKKVRGVDFQTDVNLVASFLKDQLMTGLTYRAGTGGNLGIILGTKYNTLQFIYTYDVYMDDFQKYNGGSHEITINFQFNRGSGQYDRSLKYR
ncbi:MAG: type IX secretion system PorP/SprF family membrane protein [Saprospiraceae bacterium]|jgi:type IX secretion system PorP/SprF family membrane protein